MGLREFLFPFWGCKHEERWPLRRLLDGPFWVTICCRCDAEVIEELE